MGRAYPVTDRGTRRVRIVEAPNDQRLASSIECLYPTPTQVMRHDKPVRKRGKKCTERHYLSHHYVVGVGISVVVVVQLDGIRVFDARPRKEQTLVAVVTPETVSVGDKVPDLFLRRGVLSLGQVQPRPSTQAIVVKSQGRV